MEVKVYEDDTPLVIPEKYKNMSIEEIEEEFNEDEDDFYLNYKIGITDWENSGYIFRYAEDTEDLCIK